MQRATTKIRSPGGPEQSGPGATVEGSPLEFIRELEPQIDRLYRFAILWHEGRAVAEELVVDTLVTAYRLWDAFDPGLPDRLRVFSVLRSVLREGEE